MALSNPRPNRTTLLLLSLPLLPLLAFSLTVVLSHKDKLVAQWPYSSPALWALAALALALVAVAVAAARATMVTWITVLVLLAFAGNRRRVLVKRGRTITSDVAMFLVGVLVREKWSGLVAVACATLFSLMAVVGIKEAQLISF